MFGSFTIFVAKWALVAAFSLFVYRTLVAPGIDAYRIHKSLSALAKQNKDAHPYEMRRLIREYAIEMSEQRKGVVVLSHNASIGDHGVQFSLTYEKTAPAPIFSWLSIISIFSLDTDRPFLDCYSSN